MRAFLPAFLLLACTHRVDAELSHLAGTEFILARLSVAPDAPVKVQPFTPAIFGTKQIANFTTHSAPQAGSWLLAVFATGIVVLLLWHLVAGRREAVRQAALAGAAA